MFENYVRARLSEQRLLHSFNVAATAAQLAQRYGINTSTAYQAGLLHDVARELDSEQLLNLAHNNNLISDFVELEVPVLLHGPVGAFLLRQELDLEMPDILQAVERHTTGHEIMSPLDAVIYLADTIEPGRDFPGIKILRSMAREDLWQGVLVAMEYSIKYVIEKKQLLHPITVKARNKLLVSYFTRPTREG